MKQKFSIIVPGIHKVWDFTFEGDPEHFDEWQADGLPIVKMPLDALAEFEAVKSALRAELDALRKDAARWQHLARMEAAMVGPYTLREYIARPDQLDYAASLHAEIGQAMKDKQA